MRTHITRRAAVAGVGGLFTTVAGCTGGVDADDELDQSDDEDDEPNTPGVYEWVELGDLEFRVTDAFKAEWANPGFGDRIYANGVFIVIQLEITNLGDSTISIGESLFFIVDGQERFFETDSDPMMSMDETLIHEQIHPDLSVTGELIFDVPQDQEERYLGMIHHETGNDETVFVDVSDLQWVND